MKVIETQIGRKIDEIRTDWFENREASYMARLRAYKQMFNVSKKKDARMVLQNSLKKPIQKVSQNIFMETEADSDFEI